MADITNSISWVKSLNFDSYSKCPIENEPALIKIMSWCRTGDKPSSDPKMAYITDSCVTRPQWVGSVVNLQSGDVTWALRRLTPLGTRLFQKLQVNNKQNMKSLHHWPLFWKPICFRRHGDVIKWEHFLCYCRTKALVATVICWLYPTLNKFCLNLLVICAGNSSATGEFPAQRQMTWGFEVFFDLRLSKRLSKQS